MTDKSDEKQMLLELDALFPPGVKTAISRSQASAGQLAPAEIPFAAKFTPQRLAEFRHGRDCARAALARLGLSSHAILMGSHRQPLWPPGIVGSISHAGETAASAVARSPPISALGLDIEPAIALERSLWGSICCQEEIERLRHCGVSPGLTVRMVFCAKEAVYKALWPLTQRFLEFHDIEIVLDMPSQKFSVIARTTAVAGEIAARIDGRFTENYGLIAAGASLSQ